MSLISRLTKLFYKIRNPRFTFGSRFQMDPRAFIARGGSVHIGDDCVLRAGAMLLPSGGSISIGDRTSINQYCVINGYGGVSVGSDVLIAAFTAIYSSNHVYDDKGIPIARQGLMTKGGVRIEDNVWIGAHCVILDGVTIEEGCIVAAGSVVTSSLSSFGVYGGVPAKLLKRR